MSTKIRLTRPLRNSPVNSVIKSKNQVTKILRGVPPSIEGVSTPLTFNGVVEKKADHILDLMAKLSPTERKQILAKLALTTQLDQNHGDRDRSMWATAVYNELARLQSGVGGGLGGPAVIKRVVASPSAFEPVNQFMEASKLSELTVTERQAAYNTLAGLVIANCHYVARKSGIPMSAKLVGSVATNVAGIFDQSFPGYVASGLAKIVVKRASSLFSLN